MSCPVDHQKSNTQNACPVDPTRSSWATFVSSRSSAASTLSLSTEREVSSIPKPDDGKWVYPSEAQFFAAMQRKNHKPSAADMKSIIPIHNIVNERAWAEILKWENGRGGGATLVNFKGKSNEMSPRARWRTLIGYSPPFDRHDWIVDRCGTRIRYIIDFYTGHSPAKSSGGNLSFFLDVRPALDSWEGTKMRIEHFWRRWF